MQSIIHYDIAADEDDCDTLRAIIQENILKIAEALAGNLQWYSQNAKLVPDNFKIISIQPSDNNLFKMLYDFTWDLFNPCLDLNETFTRCEEVSFRIMAGTLVFYMINNTQLLLPADEL